MLILQGWSENLEWQITPTDSPRYTSNTRMQLQWVIAKLISHKLRKPIHLICNSLNSCQILNSISLNSKNFFIQNTLYGLTIFGFRYLTAEIILSYFTSYTITCTLQVDNVKVSHKAWVYRVLLGILPLWCIMLLRRPCMNSILC